MNAVELLRSGDVDAALKRLTDQVRADPSNSKLRVFLFQLLCVTGAWDRAKTQLDVALGMDKDTLLMTRVYTEAIQCEAERKKVFAGEAAPTIFGSPLPWMAELVEAVRLDGAGQHEAATALRERALEAAPATSGRIDGTAFEWIGDADARLGPLLEVIINGRYFWLPFLRLKRITFEAPSDLRDQIWMPAQFTLANGGEPVGLIPTRYFGSEASPDPLIRMARKTDWQEVGAGNFEGRGQRLLATDGGEFALMDIRLIELDSIAEPAAAGEPPSGGEAGNG
jgi:type VI secretion system protein ImpE